MHKTLLLVVALLCGCETQSVRQYSAGQSAHVREVMTQCAAIIAKHALMLAPGEANWHYQRCLVQNNATI